MEKTQQTEERTTTIHHTEKKNKVMVTDNSLVLVMELRLVVAHVHLQFRRLVEAVLLLLVGVPERVERLQRLVALLAHCLGFGLHAGHLAAIET